MPTYQEVLDDNNTEVRQKVLKDSIPPEVIAGRLDAVATFAKESTEAISMVVATYSEMKTLVLTAISSDGNSPIQFLVTDDENKSQPFTTYNFFPHPTTPVLQWVASVKETI